MLQTDDIDLLAAFGDHANVRQAAKLLGTSKSALSRRVADLESRLGGEVFLRRGRALRVTAFGEVLIERAASAARARAEVEATAAEAGHSGGRLTIAVSPLFAEVVLPSVLARLLDRHPGARVDLRLSHAYAELFDDQVDLALRRGPLQDSTSLHARKLGVLGMTCVAAPSLPLPDATAPELRAKALPWIRVGARLEPLSIPLRLGSRTRTVLVSPRVAVDSQRLALALAENGLGVARVNTFVARASLAAGALVEVLPEAHASEAVFAVYPRRGRPHAVLRDCLSILVDVCRGLAIWD